MGAPHTRQQISFYEAVYRLVRAIPPGRVMTYGQAAAVLGCPRGARAVGQALKLGLWGGDPVPWQRVINRHGGISTGGDPARPLEQRTLLEREGVQFDRENCCNLREYLWEPPDPGEFFHEPGKSLPFR